MDREIDSLHQNETWNLTRLPKGSKALPCKWVYRVKTNPDGSIDKYKARLVVKGFAQRQGIDDDQTFSSVARMETIRSVLSVAAKNDMFLVQFDVSTAFLYGELDDMQQPEGYEQGQELVCRLKKSLYGLKQGPRCWQERFGGFLQKHNFQVSEADPCLYIRERNGKKILLVVSVDDGLAAATGTQDLEEFLDELKSEFKIVSGKAGCFLGLEIKKQKNGLKISQQGYATRILERSWIARLFRPHFSRIRKFRQQGKNQRQLRSLIAKPSELSCTSCLELGQIWLSALDFFQERLKILQTKTLRK